MLVWATTLLLMPVIIFSSAAAPCTCPHKARKKKQVFGLN